MATVRHIDQIRANRQTDDRLARVDFGAPNINPDLYPPEVPPGATTVIAPPPPVMPRPGPPPPPFGRPPRFPMDSPLIERPPPFLVPPKAPPRRGPAISRTQTTRAFQGHSSTLHFRKPSHRRFRHRPPRPVLRLSLLRCDTCQCFRRSRIVRSCCPCPAYRLV